MAPILEDGSIGAVSDVSAWHRGRNKTIRAAHPEIAKLEGSSLSTLLVLGLTNAGLLACTCAAASLSIPLVILLGVSVAATLSLWQMTLLQCVPFRAMH